MHLAAPVRITGSCTDGHWQLDPVLQRAKAASVTGLCGTTRTFSISRLRCAETRGHYKIAEIMFTLKREPVVRTTGVSLIGPRSCRCDSQNASWLHPQNRSWLLRPVSQAFNFRERLLFPLLHRLWFLLISPVKGPLWSQTQVAQQSTDRNVTEVDTELMTDQTADRVQRANSNLSCSELKLVISV